MRCACSTACTHELPARHHGPCLTRQRAGAPWRRVACTPCGASVCRLQDEPRAAFMMNAALLPMEMLLACISPAPLVSVVSCVPSAAASKASLHSSRQHHITARLSRRGYLTALQACHALSHCVLLYRMARSPALLTLHTSRGHAQRIHGHHPLVDDGSPPYRHGPAGNVCCLARLGWHRLAATSFGAHACHSGSCEHVLAYRKRLEAT